MTTLHQASWSGSYLHQLETQEVEEVVGDGDWDMDAEEAEYMANHQDIEEAEYYHIDVSLYVLFYRCQAKLSDRTASSTLRSIPMS